LSAYILVGIYKNYNFKSIEHAIQPYSNLLFKIFPNIIYYIWLYLVFLS